LDIGFGRGANLMLLAQSEFEAYGLEVSQESVDAAREMAARVNTNLQLDLLEGTDLPFEDSFYDLVVSWNAVYCYGQRSNVHDAIEEMRSVLKPGGVLLMSVIHPGSFMTRRLSFDEVEEGYAESGLFDPERRDAWRLFLARKGDTQG